ncbi:PH domain-containing protein [Streptomyces sp. MS19]|uniref:PH domain-containing protein n=1 Tax=Streptomyces sp. MS19 TaxID=3385972 RepID=UPI00399F3479
MDMTRQVICRSQRAPALWSGAAVGAAVAVLAAVGAVRSGVGSDSGLAWAFASAVGLVAAFMCAYAAVARVDADAAGLRVRTPLRRRRVPWSDVADLGVYVHRGRHGETYRSTVVMLRGGRRLRLPLPHDGGGRDRAGFLATVDALRALHRRHGAPEAADHVPVISYATAGRGSALAAGTCALLLAAAVTAAWFVPDAEAGREAWRAAVPCAAGEYGDCVSVVDAVVEEVDEGSPRSGGALHLGDTWGRVTVSHEAAGRFSAGQRVELTVWRGQVKEIAREGYVWRDHTPGGGDVAAVAIVLALGAGLPGGVLVQRRRARGLPADDLIPSPYPLWIALGGTAVWLLPLGYLHPLDAFGSPETAAWAAGGVAVTAALSAWAWRASRVRTPGAVAADAPEGGPVFLAARFLEHTDYNPHHFGTHVFLGDGGPAVTPHHGPGMFAAKRIPVERLTVTAVRRARGGDPVPSGWHVAELDDAGRPVRLAAAPDDLARVVRALERAGG